MERPLRRRISNEGLRERRIACTYCDSGDATYQPQRYLRLRAISAFATICSRISQVDRSKSHLLFHV
jgi:hypothetical protein